MNILKILTVLFGYVPAILVLTISSESLAEGVYSKSVGCIATLLLMAIANTILILTAKKGDGWKVWALYGIITLIGLSVATIF